MKRRSTVDLKAIAKRFRKTVRTVRTWRKEGAPLHDLGKLRLWLAARKHETFERRPSGDVPSAPSAEVATGDAGAAHALARLERAELTAWAELQSALASNDPLRIRQARSSWLAIGDSLRKYDALVAQSRRATGRLVPIDEVKRIVSLFILGTRIQLNRYGAHIGNDCLLAGCLPILSNDEDREWHDLIRRESASWIAQYDEHVARGLALYVECLFAARAANIPPELAGIIDAALLKCKDLPPVLPKAEWEKKEFDRMMAEGRQREGQP